MNLTIGIIDNWPKGLRTGWKSSPFRATYSDTVTLLESELEHVGAHSAILMLALQAHEIRIDGQMRANARPAHPGVILSFTSKKHGHVRMPCGTYTHWHENLRAIALSLQALRAVDRYGVTQSGEQYKGWKQLGGGIEMPAASMTLEEAAKAMAFYAGCVDRWQPMMTAVDTFKTCYQAAVKKHHPDAGGNRENWDKMQEAAAVLKNHYRMA